MHLNHFMLYDLLRIKLQKPGHAVRDPPGKSYTELQLIIIGTDIFVMPVLHPEAVRYCA